MTIEDMKEQIVQNIDVRWTGYGTWTIKSSCTDENGEWYKLSIITHNEEDFTGLFDGEEYNPVDEEELEDMLDEAKCYDENITKEDVLNTYWSDTANSDNYEPKELRNERLAIALLDDFIYRYEDYFDEMGIEYYQL